MLLSNPEIERVELKCGHIISAVDVWVSFTYAGVLEGSPNSKLHRRILSETGQASRRLAHHSGNVVIRPKLVPSAANGRHARRLPSIRIIAHFKSDSSVRNPSSDGSSLVIAWFQDQAEPLVSLEVQALIENVDWTHLAQDWDY